MAMFRFIPLAYILIRRVNTNSKEDAPKRAAVRKRIDRSTMARRSLMWDTPACADQGRLQMSAAAQAKAGLTTAGVFAHALADQFDHLDDGAPELDFGN